MAVKLLYNMDHMRAVLKGRSSSPEKSDMGEKTTIPPLMTSFIDGSFEDICLNDVSWRLSTRYLANASPESVGLETSRLKFWTRPRLRKTSRSRSARSPARTISSSRRERRCWKWSKLERFRSQQIVYMISEHTSFSKKQLTADWRFIFEQFINGTDLEGRGMKIFNFFSFKNDLSQPQRQHVLKLVPQNAAAVTEAGTRTGARCSRCTCWGVGVI